ncbi:HIT-like domain-containing protein [Aspergillus crustosus]
MLLTLDYILIFQFLGMAASDSEIVAPEALISRFEVTKLLRQDQSGRRIVLLGLIDGQQGLFLAERTAFATESLVLLKAFQSSITRVNNLGDNDIYRWYLASSGIDADGHPSHDLKLNLIWPCTEQHIKKYSDQVVRMVTETPEIYRDHIQHYMQAKREQGRLNWVLNILEGRTEQEDVILRDPGHGPEDAFLVLPDLNWDRKTIGSLHLLGLVQRRDIWSLRDLKKKHVPWLKYLRWRLLEGTVKMYPDLEEDQLKLYVHYQPTYYHFHIHVVNVMLEAGATQATGKAFGLENIISQLETMSGDEEASMADVSLTYFLGEASELWTDIYAPLKQGSKPASDH